MNQVTCQQCGTEMEKSKKVDSSILIQLLALLLFFFGFGLLFFYPIGTIIGVLIMIGTFRMGYKKRKIWQCPNCDYFFERA